MDKVQENQDQTTKWMRWIARIWSVPVILYALVFLIGYLWSWLTTGTADPYAVQGQPFQEALPPIFLFLGIVGLGIAWRWERLGGAISLFFQLIVIVMLLITRPLSQDFARFVMPYILVLITAVPGILFLICGLGSNKLTAVEQGV